MSTDHTLLNSVRTVFVMSKPQNLTQAVEEVLKQLQQATTRRVFEQVKTVDPTATLHGVRKILEEGGFAQPGLAQVTVSTGDTSYKKRTPVWTYTGHAVGVAKAQVEKGPSVEVMIMPRGPRVPYRVIEEVEHRIPEVVEFQDLQVTVKHAPVKKLQVKVLFDDGGIWFDGKIAFYLDWGGSKWIDFLENQTERMDFWLAYKIGDEEKILLNLWAGKPVILPLKELYQRPNPFIDVTLQFIGEGLTDQPRNFRLNVQSWEKINLTTEHQITK
ncbi:MAG: hypothetical protein ABSD41_13175 [Candidatus Bathyarchaeia archaeon]